MLQCNHSKDQIEFSGKICRVQFNFELKFTYIMKVPLAPLTKAKKVTKKGVCLSRSSGNITSRLDVATFLESDISCSGIAIFL